MAYWADAMATTNRETPLLAEKQFTSQQTVFKETCMTAYRTVVLAEGMGVYVECPELLSSWTSSSRANNRETESGSKGLDKSFDSAQLRDCFCTSTHSIQVLLEMGHIFLSIP
jgi:hypothetical protein